MPGTPDEYQSNPDTSKAKEVIDQTISQGGTSGDSIVQALMEAGLRVYPEGTAMEDSEEGMEELPEDEMEDEEYMDEAMMDDELEESGPSMMGGAEGGNREDILTAVRFGLEEDKKKKSQA